MPDDKRYLEILVDFCKATGIAPTVDKTPEPLSPLYIEDKDGRITTLLAPHPDGESLVIQSEILGLDLRDPSTIAEKLLLLHQINATALWSSAPMAAIDVEGVLSVSLREPLALLDGQRLAELVARVMNSADALLDAWDALDECLAASLEAAGTAPSQPPPDTTLFAKLA